MTDVAFSGPYAFYEIGELVAAGVAERISPPAGRVGVVPGAIAWDDCCDGMVAVSIGRLYVSSAFPAEQAGGTGSPCDGGDLTCELAIQVVRCAPTVDDEGTPPSTVELSAAAAQLAADSWLARQGAWCTLRTLKRSRQIEAFRLTSSAPVGPDGGCVAVALGALVAVTGGCGCDELA